MHNQKVADTQLYNYQKQTYKKCLYPVNVLNFMNFYTNVTPLALTNKIHITKVYSVPS